MATITKKQAKEINEVYNAKGLNGVYAYLRRENINFQKVIVEFGLHTNMKSHEAKEQFLKGEHCFHYHATQITAKSGYRYNMLRAIRIDFI